MRVVLESHISSVLLKETREKKRKLMILRIFPLLILSFIFHSVKFKNCGSRYLEDFDE